MFDFILAPVMAWLGISSPIILLLIIIILILIFID